MFTLSMMAFDASTRLPPPSLSFGNQRSLLSISDMDALKAEIALKRKTLHGLPAERPTKYMRRGDIERLKEEQERKILEEKRAREEVERKEAASKLASERAARKVSICSPGRIIKKTEARNGE